MKVIILSRVSGYAHCEFKRDFAHAHNANTDLYLGPPNRCWTLICDVKKLDILAQCCGLLKNCVN